MSKLLIKDDGTLSIDTETVPDGISLWTVYNNTGSKVALTLDSDIIVEVLNSEGFLIAEVDISGNPLTVNISPSETLEVIAANNNGSDSTLTLSAVSSHAIVAKGSRRAPDALFVPGLVVARVL